jgi:hypothetical protein
MSATCPEYVGSGFLGHVCGRLVKGDGLCGIHLAAKKRRQRNAAEFERARLEERQRRETATAQIDRLAELGVQAELHYEYRAGYDGRVVVDPAALLQVLTAGEHA